MKLPHGFTPCEECREKLRVAVRMERQRKAAKAKPRSESKALGKEARRERLREIRDALLQETGGRCVVYGYRIDSETMHLHHVIGGGSRRSQESALTCAPLSSDAHRAVHAGDMRAMLLLLGWCELTGRTEAAAALRRRIDKIEEARR